MKTSKGLFRKIIYTKKFLTSLIRNFNCKNNTKTTQERDRRGSYDGFDKSEPMRNNTKLPYFPSWLVYHTNHHQIVPILIRHCNLLFTLPNKISLILLILISSFEWKPYNEIDFVYSSYYQFLVINIYGITYWM